MTRIPGHGDRMRVGVCRLSGAFVNETRGPRSSLGLSFGSDVKKRDKNIGGCPRTVNESWKYLPHVNKWSTGNLGCGPLSADWE